MAHGLNSMLKREIECNNSSIKSQHPQSTIISPSSAVNNSATPSGNCGSAKMGSRRIFTPQFKLQVLESYRNDSDCKGNQRATARKYGIHRRQIQKWLQCESNLRSSVANLNQSNVKHQFHNISHQMPVVPTATHTNSNHNNQYKSNVLSLDTARHSVALTPMTLPAPPTVTTAPTVAAVVRPTTKCVNGSHTSAGKSRTTTAAMVQSHYLPDGVLTHTPVITSAPLMSHYHHHQHESLLMPSPSLPVPGSPVSAATNRTDELRDYQPITVTGNCYMNEDYRNQQIYESLQYYNSPGVAPIDLSLGPRRRERANDSSTFLVKAESSAPKSWQETSNNNNNDDYEKKDLSDPSNSAVDLSCRKRKSTCADESTPEKVQKTCNEEGIGAGDAVGKDDEQQAKPVKLFKPYLLDEDENKKIKCEPHDPIIWSRHPTCITPTGYESQNSGCSNFHSNDGYPFPTGSPPFQIHPIDRTATATPISPPATSASATTGSTYWCPKSSPVSGYDSASTYSDSSDYYRPHHQLQVYSLDFKMQAIDSYYHDMTCRGDQLTVAGKYSVQRNEVERWLDQEANIRQGIALYV